ncbi:hypothetical protein Tco_1569724 [Tanacetum coccineum]
MVAYLKKPTRSEGFQEIVDFLNGSHISYALTKNPTIYLMAKNSLLLKHLSDASSLADADGISVLPNTKIFDQLSLMGYVLTDDKLTFQKGIDGFMYKIVRQGSSFGNRLKADKEDDDMLQRILFQTGEDDRTE